MKKLGKALSIVLCGTLLVGSAGMTATRVFAEEKPAEKSTVTTAVSAAAEETTDEMVYVFTDANGSAQRTLVSNWTKNGTEGDSYTLEEQEGTLPVSMTVSYRLNGAEVSAAELAGKSGRVTIRFDYRSNRKETVTVNGTGEDVCVPFAMVTGLLLDNEVFTNVEVTNGRLINDGDRSMVVGLALPGLQEALGIEKSVYDIPEYVEITADVTEFRLGNTFSIATTEVFGRLSTEKLDSAEDLTAMAAELTDAMRQLTDGSGQLKDGLETLLTQSGTLVDGVAALAQGAAALEGGAKSLNSGAAQLAAGADTLAGGLAQLTENNDALNAGARQVFDTLLATANTQLAAAGLSVPELTVENYAAVLDGILSNMSREAVTAQATAAARQKVTAAVTAQAAAAGLTEAQTNALIEQNMASAEVQAQISAAVETAMAGAGSLTALKTQLDSYNSFYTGLTQYTAGVAAARNGADTLHTGAATLSKGAAQLAAGTTELKEGLSAMQAATPALVDGITQLRDGAKQLADGITRLDEEGVKKLTSILDGDLNGLLERVKATIAASEAYTSFTDGNTAGGQVRFLYRTEAVK